MKGRERILTYLLIALFVGVPLVWAGVTNFDAIKLIAKSGDTYQIEVDNSSLTRVFSVDSSGNVYNAGTMTVGGVITATTAGLTSPDVTYAITTKRISTSSEAFTLTAAEEKTTILVFTSGNGGAPYVIPSGLTTCTAGRIYIVRNSSNTNLIIKASGGTGVTVASTKTAAVYCGGLDFFRLTADATN